jgi:hypothetical protein
LSKFAVLKLRCPVRPDKPLVGKGAIMKPQFFAAERYDRELKQFLDDRDEPVYVYIVRDHLVGERYDEYDPYAGSGLPEFLVSPTKLTDEQITELFNVHYSESVL